MTQLRKPNRKPIYLGLENVASSLRPWTTFSRPWSQFSTYRPPSRQITFILSVKRFSHSGLTRDSEEQCTYSTKMLTINTYNINLIRIILDVIYSLQSLQQKGPFHDPVTWCGINYAGTQVTQWHFQNKGKSRWTGTSYFVLEVPLCNLHSSIIYSVPCDKIGQRAYCCYW